MCREEMELHAVAPGGPPEGQCKKEHELVCNTTFDDLFRTAGTSIHARVASMQLYLIMGRVDWNYLTVVSWGSRGDVALRISRKRLNSSHSMTRLSTRTLCEDDGCLAKRPVA